MKSYITIKRKWLDKETASSYKAMYNGLVESIRTLRSPLAPIYFAREMTILIMLFTAVYDLENVSSIIKGSRRRLIINEATGYISNIDIIMTSLAEKYFIKMRLTNFLKRAARTAYINNPSKAISIEKNIEKIAVEEKLFVTDAEAMSSDFGKVLSEILAWKEDDYQKSFRDFGFYLGKFLFLCYCYERINLCEKKDLRNPLLYTKRKNPEVFDAYIISSLKSLFDECMACLEKFPVSEKVDAIKELIYKILQHLYKQSEKQSRISGA